MKLYHFPISHYCEKIRWALDYKGIPFQFRHLAPGFHLFTTQKIAPKTSVPIIEDEGKIVQNSSTIITYLDEKFPQKSLTPLSKNQKDEALQWEKYVDKEIGSRLRCYFYYHLLPSRSIVVPLLTNNSPWYTKCAFHFAFLPIRQIMHKKMNITAQTSQESKERLQNAIDKLSLHMQGRQFMVGDSFSRADLAAVSLLAPIFEPLKYGLKWPSKIPLELKSFKEQNLDKIQWACDLYEEYR